MAAAHSHERPAVAFARETACRIAGVSPQALAAWDAATPRGGFRWPASLGMGGLVALILLRDVGAQLGSGLCAFRPGLSQLFRILEQTREVSTLAERTAVIGHDFARLCELRTVHVDCDSPQFLVRPLAPVVAELKDLVFS